MDALIRCDGESGARRDLNQGIYEREMTAHRRKIVEVRN
jgi:hypothetical protein